VDSLKCLRPEQRLRVPPSSAASLLVPDPVLLRAKPSDSYAQFKAMNPESGPDLDRALKNASEYNRYLVRDGRISLDAPSGQYSFLTMKPGVKNVYIHARGFSVAFDTKQTNWQKSFVLGLQKPSLAGKTVDSVLGFHLDSQGLAVRHMAPCFFPASMGSRSVPELAPRPGPHKAHDYELYMVYGDVELFVDGQRFFYGPAANNDEPLEPHILVCGAQCELSQVVVLELLKPDEITESWRKEINKKFEWGNTRLHAMVSGCTVAQLKSLVAQGADIHAKNSDGDTPLHIAAINRREEVVQYLISQGSKMDLRVATVLGDLATLKTLLAGEAKNELNLNTVSWTPLFGARWHGYGSTAALLLENGADPNIPAGSLFGKCYPIHMAVMTNNEALVKLLLDKGAKVNVTNFRGQTPLLMAESIIKSDSLVQLLRARGARNNGGKAVKPPAPPASEAPYEF
jgi:hypothetical protein